MPSIHKDASEKVADAVTDHVGSQSLPPGIGVVGSVLGVAVGIIAASAFISSLRRKSEQ